MHVGALMKGKGRGKASKGGKGNKGSGKARSRGHNRRCSKATAVHVGINQPRQKLQTAQHPAALAQDKR